MQYQVQREKGGHLDTNLSEDKCVRTLFIAVKDFKDNLNPIQRELLFKIKSPFNGESWKNLPARPIRSGENCPINGFSKALCKLLQELYSKIEDNFYNGDFGQNFSFPIIYGCEEY